MEKAGEAWTEALKEAVMKRISITDYSKIIPLKKEKYKNELSEFSEFSEAVGRRVVDGLTSMELATSAKYHVLRTGD